MRPTIVLTATVALVITTVLLLVGRHVRISSRLLGLLLAAVVGYGSAELSARL